MTICGVAISRYEGWYQGVGRVPYGGKLLQRYEFFSTYRKKSSRGIIICRIGLPSSLLSQWLDPSWGMAPPFFRFWSGAEAELKRSYGGAKAFLGGRKMMELDRAKEKMQAWLRAVDNHCVAANSDERLHFFIAMSFFLCIFANHYRQMPTAVIGCER